MSSIGSQLHGQDLQMTSVISKETAMAKHATASRCQSLFSVRFLARDSLTYAIARYMLSPVGLSVRLSVTRVDQSKTVEARIMQLTWRHATLCWPVIDRKMNDVE